MRLRLALGDVGLPGTGASAMVRDCTAWPLAARRGANFSVATSARMGPAALAVRAAS